MMRTTPGRIDWLPDDGALDPGTSAGWRDERDVEPPRTPDTAVRSARW